MNQGARGVAGWIRSAYDKLALFVVLFVLLLSVILLGVFVGQEKKELAAARWNQSNVASRNSRPVDTSIFHDAIESLVEPVQMAAFSNRMMVAELRVACDKCGRPIPVSAQVCPYKNCGAVQPAFMAAQRPADADLDIMPDAWEKQYNLNPAADDSRKDADGDRWFNLEEFQAQTNPRDSGDHPPPVSKLRWIRTQWTTLPFSFQSVLHPAPNENVFVLKNRNINRDFYVQLGDKIEGGYEVLEYEPKTMDVYDPSLGSSAISKDVSVLKLRKGDRLIVLTLGQDALRGELAAELIYLIDQSKYPVKVNFVVALDNDKYKVVDIQKDDVVVSNVLTGEKTALEKYSESDRTSNEDR